MAAKIERSKLTEQFPQTKEYESKIVVLQPTKRKREIVIKVKLNEGADKLELHFEVKDKRLINKIVKHAKTRVIKSE